MIRTGATIILVLSIITVVFSLANFVFYAWGIENYYNVGWGGLTNIGKTLVVDSNFSWGLYAIAFLILGISALILLIKPQASSVHRFMRRVLIVLACGLLLTTLLSSLIWKSFGLSFHFFLRYAWLGVMYYLVSRTSKHVIQNQP